MSGTDMFDDDWAAASMLPADSPNGPVVHTACSEQRLHDPAAAHNQWDTPLVMRHASTFTVAGPQEHPESNGSILQLRAVGVSRTFASATLTLSKQSDIVQEAEASPVRIARPPAGRLIAALRCVLTAHAFDSMVAPYIAQEQHEYYEALLQKDDRQARIIAARMHLMIWYNVLCAIATSITRLIRRPG